MAKFKEKDFFFPEQMLINYFGKEEVKRMKKEDPEAYATFRNSPLFMPSDVVYEDQKSAEDN